jgi:hypothetical protein
MPRTDVFVPERSIEPRRRVAPASDGRLSWGLAWKVCAFLPLALLCTAMVVQAAADRGNSGSREAARGADTSAISSSSAGPTPILTTADRAKKRHAAKSTPSPSASPSSATPAPASDTPSPKPTKSPSTTSPSPAPTPEEARQRCLAEGSNPMDLGALAECIANKMGD